MWRLKLLLVGLALTAFSGCAAYSVMNNDRYYDSWSSLPEGQDQPSAECRNGYLEQQPTSASCKNLHAGYQQTSG